MILVDAPGPLCNKVNELIRKLWLKPRRIPLKKLLIGLAAMSMAMPSAASAATASQALSVKAAAVQPVRASAEAGEAKAVKPAFIVAAVIALGGVIYLIAKGDSN